MRKNLLIAIFVSFSLGLFINNFAMSKIPANFKVGIIDVKEVVQNSKQVLDLQNDQIKQTEELKKFIINAQNQISKETDENKKQELIKKFEKEVTDIKKSNDKKYAKKLAAIDKSISKTIQEESQKAGYDLVLSKGVVLYGGTDITSEITKAVK